MTPAFPSLPDDDPTDEPAIRFAEMDVDRPALFTRFPETTVAGFLAAFAKTYHAEVVSLDYVFCSDETLHEMNVNHLAHDTLTDIITFDLRDAETDANPAETPAPESLSSAAIGARSAVGLRIEGECYISTDRVIDNAASFGESPDRELIRVMAHGLLHLCGLSDKDETATREMRAAEADALARWEAETGEG